jgi:protein-S-isoprenylcysteine O-methyltransferase Ste14
MDSQLTRSDVTDRAKVRFPPPLVFLLALATGAGLNLVVPLALNEWIPELALLASGALAELAGFGLLLASLGLFKGSGQRPEPWTTTPEIITHGIYRWTRNPMYLGMALVQGGIGLLMANGWVVLLTPFAAWMVHHIAIRHEEVYLSEKFGAPYREYLRSVRRWF